MMYVTAVAKHVFVSGDLDLRLDMQTHHSEGPNTSSV